MPHWELAVEIDDTVAVTIGRTVAPSGDAASQEECRMAFGAALSQFVARAVAERYSTALAARAQVRANDLASAIVTAYPDGYDPMVTRTPLNLPPGPEPEFTTGPAADPSSIPSTAADLEGEGNLAATSDGAPIG